MDLADGLTLDPRQLAGLGLYVVVFGLVFTESGLLPGFWLPGDTVLFAAGLASADPSIDVNTAVLATGAALAAVAGNVTGYLVGHRLGRPVLLRYSATALARTEVFYQRFGPFTLVAARFVPWVRTFAPAVGGAAAMPLTPFLSATAAGAVIWGGGQVALGYAAASSPGLKHGTITVAVTVGTIITLAVLIRAVRRRRESRHTGVRPGEAG